MKRTILIISIIVSGLFAAKAQNLNNIQLEHMQKQSVRREIAIPNIMGFQTLKCDFHMHTVFSDGIAWPTYRVDEAWEEGLDAISITDHIEGHPSKPHIGGDYNAPYDIALPRAIERDIILVRGAEITRPMPPGHLNAIFLDDVNPLATPDAIDAIKAAHKQGAFITWNHPGWKAQQPDTCIWMPVIEELYQEGIIHGIEVFNEKEWYPIAVDWCIDKDLAILGYSDIHDITAHYYDLDNQHRPMTLVFAKDRSKESLKEAMFDKRTVAFFDNKLVGKEEFLKEIFKNSVSFKNTGNVDRRQNKLIEIKNVSDIPFELEDTNGRKVLVPRLASIIVPLEGSVLDNVTVNNLITGSYSKLKISIEL